MKPTLVVVTAILASAAASPTRADVLADFLYDPGVDLGGGERLQQLTGRLVMMATPVPGLATHADGNAWLRLVGPGALDATGTWGTMRVAVDRLELFGGVARRHLHRVRQLRRRLLLARGRRQVLHRWLRLRRPLRRRTVLPG